MFCYFYDDDNDDDLPNVLTLKVVYIRAWKWWSVWVLMGEIPFQVFGRWK